MISLYQYILSGNKLSVQHVNSTYVGDYECQNDGIRALFTVRTKPRVKFNSTQMQRSQTVIVSGTWSISCMFVDEHYGRSGIIDMIRCTKEQAKLKPWCGQNNQSELIKQTKQWIRANEARVTLDKVNNTYITLSIVRAQYQDIGVFYCYGNNSYAHNNISILLRVRDRYDFNWPMVLLAGLALYLFSLVTIFETRRIRATSFLKFSNFTKIK